MFFISKEDKKTWSEYISNIDSYSLNINSNKKIISKKSFSNTNFKETKSFSKLIKKGLLRVDSVIDLHGYRLNDARIAIKKFIVMAYKCKHKNILVITGKGKDNAGVLKTELPNWLCEKEISKYVVSHISAPKKLGGEGAVLIRLKNINKSVA